MLKKYITGLFSLAMVGMSLQAMVDLHNVDAWNELCNEGNYQQMLIEQYQIMKSGFSSDNLNAQEWRKNRFAKHFEFPIAWAQLAYFISTQLAQKDAAQDSRIEEMVKMAFQAYIRLHIDAGIFGAEGYERVNPILKKFKEGKLKAICKKLTRAEYDCLLEEACNEFKVVQGQSSVGSLSQLIHPEVVMRIALANKTAISYLNPANYYQPGIEVDELVGIKISDDTVIANARSFAYPHAVEALRKFGQDNLSDKE